MSGIAIRFYEEGDDEAIAEFLDRVFGGWPKFDVGVAPVNHWRWKHLDNPTGGSVVLVTVKDGKIVGANHSIPIRVKVGESEALFAEAVDLAVDPEYRQMGIRTTMREKKYERLTPLGINFIMSVTGNPIIIESSLRENMPKFPHPIAGLARIHDIDLHLRMMPVDHSWVKKAGFHALKLVSRFGKSFTSPSESAENLEIREITSFDERINTFWEEISSNFDYIGVRDRSYLNWRYCDPRSGGFEVRQAEEGGRVVGYIAYRVNRYIKEYPIGYVVDLLTCPERTDVSDSLIGEAVDHFDGAGVNIVNTLVIKGNPIEKAFEEHDFLDSRIRLHAFLRPVSSTDEIEKLPNYSADRIHFNWGDHDSLPLSTIKHV